MGERATLPNTDHGGNVDSTWVIYFHPGALDQECILDNRIHVGIIDGHNKIIRKSKNIQWGESAVGTRQTIPETSRLFQVKDQ